ncbi:MAG: YlbF family regulator [Clostridia bacterium]|nr:YlbF family regulator [Clostridia bacterium]
MTAYDKAHELAEALAKSEEYRAYVEAKQKLEQDRANSAMLDEFRKHQLELQIAEITGQEIDEEKAQQLDHLYQILSLNPTINEFLSAEYRLARLLADIQKIIGEAVKAWFPANQDRTMN